MVVRGEDGEEAASGSPELLLLSVCCKQNSPVTSPSLLHVYLLKVCANSQERTPGSGRNALGIHGHWSKSEMGRRAVVTLEPRKETGARAGLHSGAPGSPGCDLSLAPALPPKAQLAWE